jgi:hypothetical protein
MPPNPSEQVLYRYPAHVNDQYVVDGDAMLVAAVNTSLQIGDSLYTGIIIYQRQTPTNRLQIWIKPETIGILREDSLNYNGSTLLSWRELTYHFVQQ